MARKSVNRSRKLDLDGRDFQIAGVLSLDQAIEGSYGLNQPEVFVQIGCDSQERPNPRGDMNFQLIGRMRPEVTVDQTTANSESLRWSFPTWTYWLAQRRSLRFF